MNPEIMDPHSRISIHPQSRRLILEVAQLQKSFKDFRLQNASFSLTSSSVVGLIGRNGAGKSTLLKTCMGIIQKDSGIIRFEETDVGMAGLPREEVGFVAENHPLYDSMQVQEFLRFCSAFYDSWDWAYCKDLQHSFRIPNKLIRDLSHGTRSKLALTAALSFHPKLLLLDEPTTGLDPSVRREFLLELQACVLANRKGQAVVLSSHILEDIETIADQVLVMREGQLSSYSSLNELPNHWAILWIEGAARQVHRLLSGLSATVFPSNSRTDSKIILLKDDLPVLLARCADLHFSVIEEQSPTLQEIFAGML